MYHIAGMFCGEEIFEMERICENYVLESLHMCMRGAGMHLHCTSNKPTNRFCNTFIYGYANIYHREKYPLCITSIPAYVTVLPCYVSISIHCISVD